MDDDNDNANQDIQPSTQEPLVVDEPVELKVRSSPELDAWFGKWFPENPQGNHPIPYLSQAWHHVQAALEDLKQRLADK